MLVLSDVRGIELKEGVPNGKYDGLWSGTTVWFLTPDGAYLGETDEFIQGTAMSCAVTVLNGRYSLEVTAGESYSPTNESSAKQ